MSNTYCVAFMFFFSSSSCVPYVASFFCVFASGLSFFNCPFDILMNEPVNVSLVEHSVARIHAILTNISYLSYVKLIDMISDHYLAIYKKKCTW